MKLFFTLLRVAFSATLVGLISMPLMADENDQATLTVIPLSAENVDPQWTMPKADSAEDEPSNQTTIEGATTHVEETELDLDTNATIISEDTTAQPSIVPEVHAAITIYVDASWGSRTEKAAANLSQEHSDYAQKGYRLQDVDLYIENGDLKGFFVTYIK